MHDTAGGGISDHHDPESNRYQAIVSDLVSLVERMHACTKAIESAMAGEATFGNQEVAPGVIELDDVTPRYVRTHAALETCTAGLCGGPSLSAGRLGINTWTERAQRR